MFMNSLYEAIGLVILVSLIGFGEWRSALLMVGLDIQQISIASLIIALGLLVDDPVVAGDAIAGKLAKGSRAASRRGWDRRNSQLRFFARPS